MFAHRAHAKKLELNSQLLGAVPRRVLGDPDRLRQVFVNLVGNSLKFTEQGGVLLRAEPEQAADGTAETVAVRFEIIDTGIGIPPERIGRLFQAFSQADASTTRKYGGTGLGLAISKQLVELMGGEIGVDEHSRARDRHFGSACHSPWIATSRRSATTASNCTARGCWWRCRATRSSTSSTARCRGAACR